MSLLGSFALVIRGGRNNYGLVLGLLALLLMLVTFFSFHYGVAIMYERGLLYMMLTIGIIAGAGLKEIKNLQLPAAFESWLRIPLVSQNIGKFLALAIAAVILVISLPQRQQTPYYHMIYKEDYQAFVWIKNNVSQEYNKAILDPWKATAFTAITGRRVFTRIHMAPLAQDNFAYDFIMTGSSNTTFLRQNGISVIYTRVYDLAQNKTFEYDSNNPDLIEVNKNIYLLDSVKTEK